MTYMADEKRLEVKNRLIDLGYTVRLAWFHSLGVESPADKVDRVMTNEEALWLAAMPGPHPLNLGDYAYRMGTDTRYSFTLTCEQMRQAIADLGYDTGRCLMDCIPVYQDGKKYWLTPEEVRSLFRLPQHPVNLMDYVESDKFGGFHFIFPGVLNERD